MKGTNNLSPYEKAYVKMLSKEALAIYNMQRNWKNNNGSIYIPFEDANINWYWNPKQVGWFDELWEKGISVQEISKRMRRPLLEVILLLMDRNYRGKIKPRDGGIWGI